MLHYSQEEVKKIATALKNGSVVGLPTETVFGLAVSLHSPTALEKLIFLKKRDISSGKVFTLVPSSPDDIQKYAIPTKISTPLIKKYIPGEVTLILPKNPEFSHPYFNHFDTIGIRIPKYSLFQTILKDTGPLLLTSANPRGGVPAKTAEDVKKSLPKIDVIVTGTPGNHLPSTIIDCTTNPPKTLRQGSLIPRID